MRRVPKPLKSSGKLSRKAGIPEEQGTSQKIDKNRKEKGNINNSKVEGISRSEEIDNPETKESNKKKNHNHVKKIRTIATIGTAIGNIMSKIDEKSVEPRQWITDKIISFAIRTIKDKVEYQMGEENVITLIDPCVAHLLRRINNIETCKEIIEETGIKNSTTTFIPLNNSVEKENTGGNHWSLLVFRKVGRKNEFLHYDPIRGMNKEVAKDMAKKMKKTDRIYFSETTR